MAGKSPTKLTLAHLRADERFELVEVVEHWNPHARVRQDLFGIFDVIAIGPGVTLGVQCTSEGGFYARLKKLREHPNTPAALRAGWLIEVHGWAKKSNRWTLAKRREFQFDAPQEG